MTVQARGGAMPWPTRNSRIVEALLPPKRTDLVATMKGEDAGRAFAGAERLFAPAFTCTLVWPHGQAHYDGPEGLWTAWNDWLRSWRHYVVESYELDAASDHVLVITRARGVVAAERDPDGRRCSMAGQEVEARPATIWRLRDRQLLSADFYDSRLDALDALGLVE